MRSKVWAGIVLAVMTAATWWAWLGWDDEYQVDPVTGVSSGPYEAWQVVGCVLSLVVLCLAGGALLGAAPTAGVVTVAFTITWAVWAASGDGSGLWLVGAALVFAGLAVGSTVTGLVGQWLGGAGRRRRAPSGA
jgi:hypothetical protein